MKVWLELKYGDPQVSTTLWRVDDLGVLKLFKVMLLGVLEEFTQESESVDKVIHTMDRMNLRKAQQLLNLVIPDTGNGDEVE